MNKRKKQIYAAVLLAGGMALLMDRVFLGSSPAEATAQGLAGRSLTALGVESLAGSVISVQAAAFPNLESIDLGPDDQRDIFAAGEIALAALYGETDDSGERIPGARGVRQSGGRTSAPFEQTHRLTGVMLSPNNAFAIVDGEWIRVGDRVDRCELIEITGTTATFNCQRGKVILSVIADSLKINETK